VNLWLYELDRSQRCKRVPVTIRIELRRRGWFYRHQVKCGPDLFDLRYVQDSPPVRGAATATFFVNSSYVVSVKVGNGGALAGFDVSPRVCLTSSSDLPSLTNAAILARLASAFLRFASICAFVSGSAARAHRYPRQAA
jgi:hypothetical protein